MELDASTKHAATRALAAGAALDIIARAPVASQILSAARDTQLHFLASQPPVLAGVAAAEGIKKLHQRVQARRADRAAAKRAAADELAFIRSH